jgi:hypothetical protein
MPNLKSLLLNIAKKDNIDTVSADNKAFFEGIPDFDVPETINTGIDNSLLSLADAKNNHPDIQNHYKAQILAGLDSTVKGIMDELAFDDASKAEILGERSSYKRVDLLTKKIKELENGKGKNTTNQTQQEIDRLNAQLREEKAKLTQREEEYAQKLLSRDIREQVKKLVAKGTFPTKYDDLDEELRLRSLMVPLDEELQSKGAKWHLDENGNLAILKNDGSTLYSDNHQQVIPKSFVESNLTRNKIIQPATTALPGSGKPNLPASANGQAGNKNAQPGVADFNKKQAEAIFASLKADSQGLAI